MMKNGEIDSDDINTLLEYLKTQITSSTKNNCCDFRIIYPVIKFNSLLKVDGYYYYIGGNTGNSYYLYDAVSLKLPFKEISYIKKIDKALTTNDFGERDTFGNIIITTSKNISLFDELISKINKGIYLHRKGTLISTLNDLKKNFYVLDIPNQCRTIQNLISAFCSKTQTVDLSPIGGTKNSGKMTLSKRINGLTECKLINLSVTGLYENRVDLLKL